MLKDKSRLLVFGALVLLVVAFSNGGLHFNGFRFFHGFSWLSWALFGLFIWLLMSRVGCCGNYYEEEEVEEEGDEAE